MARNDLLVGLDVGTTKICTVVGEASENGVDIIGIGTAPSTGLRRGVVVNIEKTVQCIKKSLEDAELMAGCDIRTVYAGIAGSHIQGFNSHGVIAVKGGEVTQRDVDRVIEAAKAIAIPMDREVLHTLPQEFIVDDQRGIADPLGMAGVRLEVKVHIVTGAVTSAQNIIRSCNRSGLDVSNIVLESLASSKAVLSPEEREIGVALVDIGGGTTDIAVFSKDSIKHTSVLALGGHNLTNDIAYGLRTPMMSAEKIKMDFGCAMADLVTQEEIIEVPSVGGRESRKMSKRVLSEICEPRCEEILALVDQELIKSGFKNMIAAGVVLTGGTVMIEGMQELAEQIFDLPVRIGVPGEGIGGLTAEVRSPKYATAVGLLLHGAEEEGLHKVRPFKIRDDSGFDRIVSRMKKWFTDIA
nr:cell division protein FtsA [uncultured Pseudodesulfovibrio sp.]